MVSLAFRDLCQYFEAEEYQAIPTDSETVQMFALYELDTLYLVNVIELSEFYAFDRKRYEEYRDVTRRQFEHVGADHIKLLNLMLIENPDMIYKEVNYMPELHETFEDYHWIVDTCYNELVIPKKQHRSFYHLDQDLELALAHEDTPKYVIHEKNKSAFVSGSLIIAILGLYMAMVFVEGSFLEENLIKLGALYGNDTFKNGEIWRLITYFIVHTDPFYMIISAFYIFFFGSKLERYIKWYEMLLIIFGSSIFAGIFVSVIHYFTGSTMVTTGGAAMAYGIIGSVIVYNKLAEKEIDGLNEYLVLILFLLGIAVSISNNRVNTLLHIGGFIGGIAMTFIILRNYRHRVMVE